MPGRLTRSGSEKSRLRHQMNRPISPQTRPRPRPAHQLITGSPAKPISQLKKPAIDRPTTPPQPPVSDSTASAEKKASAVAVKTTPRLTPRNMVPQLPTGRSLSRR